MTDKKPEPKASDPELQRLLFENLMAHTTDSVYFKDLASRFLALSNPLAKFFDLTDPSGAIGKTDHDFFTAEHADQALADEQSVISTGEPIVGKEELETWPDGRRTWALTSKLPLLNEKGEITGTFGISKNITKRKEAEEALRQSEESLRQHLDMMEKDLEKARTIQRALLSNRNPKNDRIDVEYRYHPLESIGGDFFAFHTTDNGSLTVFLGDLAGHGVSAALFMALVKFLADRLHPEYTRDPAAYLKQLNTGLMDKMHLTFLTAIYGVFEFNPDDTGASFRTAGAGHPFPISYCAATDSVQRVPLKGNAAIGIIDDFETAETVLPLAPGDRLFLYTDGLSETTSENKELLGDNRILEFVKAHRHDSLAVALDAITDAAHDFRGEAEMMDDMALIGFEIL